MGCATGCSSLLAFGFISAFSLAVLEVDALPNRSSPPDYSGPPPALSIEIKPYPTENVTTTHQQAAAHGIDSYIAIPLNEDGNNITVQCPARSTTYPRQQLQLEWYWKGEKRGHITDDAASASTAAANGPNAAARPLTKAFLVDFNSSHLRPRSSQFKPGHLMHEMDFRCSALNRMDNASGLTRVLLVPYEHVNEASTMRRQKTHAVPYEHVNEASTVRRQNAHAVPYEHVNEASTVRRQNTHAGSARCTLPNSTAEQTRVHFHALMFGSAFATMDSTPCRGTALLSTDDHNNQCVRTDRGPMRLNIPSCAPLCNSDKYTRQFRNGAFTPMGITKMINGTLFSAEYRIVCNRRYHISKTIYNNTCRYDDHVGFHFPDIPKCERDLCNTALYSVENGRFKPWGQKRIINGSMWSANFRVVCNGGFRVSHARYQDACVLSHFPRVPTCEPFTCRVRTRALSQSVKKSLCDREWSFGAVFKGRNSSHIKVTVQQLCRMTTLSSVILSQLGPVRGQTQGCAYVFRSKKKLSIRMVGQSCARWGCADHMIQNKNYFMSGMVHRTSPSGIELVMSRDSHVVRWCNHREIKKIARKHVC